MQLRGKILKDKAGAESEKTGKEFGGMQRRMRNHGKKKVLEKEEEKGSLRTKRRSHGE